MLAAAVALALAVPAVAEDPGARGDPATVVEQVVAVVRNPPTAAPRVVTWTKLVEEARIALVSRGATEAASGTLDHAALRAALEWLVDQMLLADEAATLRLDEASREEVVAELRAFQGRFFRRADYERFLERSEVPEDELLATLGRMVRVQRYVRSRVGSAARVGDDEVDRWLQERGAGPATAAVRDAARAQLTEEKMAAQVQELLRDLRARADVRILGEMRGGGRD